MAQWSFGRDQAIPPASDDLVRLVRRVAEAERNRGGVGQPPLSILPETVLAILARLDVAEGRRP